MFDIDPKKIKKSLTGIAPNVFRNPPVLFAYLYGSFAVELVHPFSDIDIGVYVGDFSFEKSLDLELTLSLKIDEKLDCKAKSEVRIINYLPLVIKGKIVTEGILIYSANEVERVNFESSVRGAYFDFLPVIKSYQRSYFESVEF